MVFTVKIAEHFFEIHSLFDSACDFCKDYVVTGEKADAVVAITPEVLRQERRIERADAATADASLELLAIHRLISLKLLDDNVLLFHGSALKVKDAAYIFTAKSGVGKTTHSRLWLRNIKGSSFINGDKPFLHFDGAGATVFGSPWNGKEHFGANTSAPLKAICLLERAEKNRIEEITLSEALPTLISQSFYGDAGDYYKAFLLFSRLQAVRFFRLKCNMEDEAALVSYSAMK